MTPDKADAALHRRGHPRQVRAHRRQRSAPEGALPAPPRPETNTLKVPARGTLARRLIVGVTIITTTLAILLGTLTTVVARQVLMDQLDRRLTSALDRQPGTDRNAEGFPVGADLPGQPIGAVVIYVISPNPQDEAPDETAINGILTRQGIQAVPSNAALNTLYKIAPDDRAVSVDLQMLGPYRAQSRIMKENRVIVALPLDDTQEAILTLLGKLAAITLLAILVGLLCVYLVVVRNLRPMTDLASAAHAVTATPLEHGQVTLSVRAPTPRPGQAAEFTDVSEAFNQMLGHVESALQARQLSESRVRRFVADASHELRNPLAAIRGYAELTRRDRDTMPPQTARALTRIDAEAERMSALVEDLLLLARLDNDPTSANEPVDLSEVVVNATADAQVAGPDHSWSLDVPPEPVTMTGDRHQIHQVVANLLANARTHTPAGTHVNARLAVDHEPGTARPFAVVTIQDDGPGIPAAMIGQVFDRFVRADSARVRIPDSSARAGSTGLGLSIVAAVVGAHGGTVQVSSRCAAGLPDGATSEGDTWTTFTVRLPLTPRPVIGAGSGH